MNLFLNNEIPKNYDEILKLTQIEFNKLSHELEIRNCNIGN